VNNLLIDIAIIADWATLRWAWSTYTRCLRKLSLFCLAIGLTLTHMNRFW